MENNLHHQKLKICYKGNRDYVYASDVFSQVQEMILKLFPDQKITDIDFSTHKKAHNNIEVFIYDHFVEKSNDIHAIFNFKANGNQYYAQLMETEKKIECSNVYDEEMLFNSFALSQNLKVIETNKKYEYSTMDIFTSLNKMLLTKRFPEVTTGWLSVRCKLNKPLPPSYQKLTVIFIKNFSNKYYQSELYINDKLFGQIFFSIK
jgi:hypothetical protein